MKKHPISFVRHLHRHLWFPLLFFLSICLGISLVTAGGFSYTDTIDSPLFIWGYHAVANPPPVLQPYAERFSPVYTAHQQERAQRIATLEAIISQSPGSRRLRHFVETIQ